MTTKQQLADELTAAQDKAARSIYKHQIAMQAFNVAIARYDWKLAEKEQAAVLAHLSENMDALQTIYRIREQL